MGRLISVEAQALQSIAEALESIACSLTTLTSKPTDLKDDTPKPVGWKENWLTINGIKIDPESIGVKDLSDWHIEPTQRSPSQGNPELRSTIATHSDGLPISNLNIPMPKGIKTRYTP